MVDVHTKQQRSYNMSRVRSKWTKQETKFHNFLKGRKIKHTMHPALSRNPDIYLPKNNTVVFLDGCFWHGCPKCSKKPASNVAFWENKISRNKRNDRKVNKLLKSQGHRVIRIWECKIKADFEDAFDKLFD